MKKLQNNFTTPEQSERLLKLGVPADSADCYIEMYSSGYSNTKILFEEDSFSKMESFCAKCKREIIPCWSVGRLIEIYGICAEFKNAFVLDNCYNPIDTIMNKIEALVKHGYDFSKLEK